MAKKRKATSNAIDIIHRRYYAGKPKRLADLEEARANSEVARLLKSHGVRFEDGLSGWEIAQREVRFGIAIPPDLRAFLMDLTPQRTTFDGKEKRTHFMRGDTHGAGNGCD